MKLLKYCILSLNMHLVYSSYPIYKYENCNTHLVDIINNNKIKNICLMILF